MKKILAIGASNSSQSINRQLAQWAAGQVQNASVNTVDLNHYEMPLFSSDREKDEGIPQQALDFKNLIKESDAIVLSLAEHNGSYTAAFKNIIDWVSRVEKGLWANKPMFLLATSPGPRGAQGVLDTAVGSFPYQGAEVMAHFSLPSFGQSFDIHNGITHEGKRVEFADQLAHFTTRLSSLEETTTEV